MNLDVNNFNNFTEDEFRDNLIRLGAARHSDLIGTKVYYSKKIYGLHTIVKWNPDKAEFLLDLDGDRFWSNPFRVFVDKCH